jgi:hypothetical protein
MIKVGDINNDSIFMTMYCILLINQIDWLPAMYCKTHCWNVYETQGICKKDWIQKKTLIECEQESLQ